MNNKIILTHLFCLFIFICGCGLFWLLGGGEGESVTLSDTMQQKSEEEKTGEANSLGKNNLENPSIGNIIEEEERQTSHNTSINNGDGNGCEISSSSYQDSVEKSGNDRVVRKDKKDVKSADEKDVNEDIDESTDFATSTKVSDGNTAYFHPMGENIKSTTENSIRAVVHETHKNVDETSQVKLRLLDDVKVNGISVPKNIVVYADVKVSGNRIMLSIESITHNKKVYPFNASVYDLDGEEGISINSLMTGKQKDMRITLPSGYRLTIKKR